MEQLNLLNDQQLAFVNSPSKRITVSARPGTGKTHAFAWRIFLDQDRGMDPSTQVIVTKTVTAARNMRNRLETIAGQCGRTYVEPYFIGTIHALALHLMNERGHVLGYKYDIEVLHEDDSREIMNYICEKIGANTVSAWKRRGSMLKKTTEHLAATQHLKTLRIKNQTDFACMLTEAARIMDIMPSYGFNIYVDENQDTAIEEANLLRALKPVGWIVIGDEDQSIFGWDNDLDDFYSWDSKVMDLYVNYRSRECICKSANNIAQKFTHERGGAQPMTWVKLGGCVADKRYDNDRQSMEAAIAHAIDDIGEGCSVAILCRHNHLANQIKIMAGSELAGETTGSLDGAKPSEIRNAQKWLATNPTLRMVSALYSASLTNRERRIVEMAISKSNGSREVALASILDPDEPESSKLHIGTVHSFKGREADHVYLVGAEDIRWEKKRGWDNDERKLFYVALTRARSSFTALSSSKVYIDGKGDVEAKPSCFVSDMIKFS